MSNLVQNIDESSIENAIIEAAYWWKRSESYYHGFFKNIEDFISLENSGDEKVRVNNFFINKIFNVFLREYSVARNISSGKTNELLIYLNKNGFFAQVADGELKIIDSMSQDLTDTELTNGRQCRSLLSKIAFLANPSVFSLIDTYARRSLWKIYNEANYNYSQKRFEHYVFFISCSNNLLNSDLSNRIDSVFNKFKKKERDILEEILPGDRAITNRRVLDKLLWIQFINGSGNKENIDNSGFLPFLDSSS